MHPAGRALTSDCYINSYRLQTKLRESNVFTPVCDSFHRGGGVSQHAMGRGGAHLPLARHPPRQTPPCPTGMATEAGGTHPTPMHSCFKKVVYEK